MIWASLLPIQEMDRAAALHSYYGDTILTKLNASRSYDAPGYGDCWLVVSSLVYWLYLALSELLSASAVCKQ